MMAETELLEDNAAASAGKTSDASVMRTGGSIAIATLVSRITGFIRTVLVLAMLGGAVSSAFQAAYVLPNMIAEVVLGAVLTAIVIPVLARAEAEDDDGGADFINRIFTLALLVLTLATVAALVAAPVLTAMNVGDGHVDRDLATALAYLLLPEILFYGLSALFMAILNMRNIFKPGAWAPVLNNIVQIITLVLYFVMPGEITANPLAMSDPKLLVLGVGTTIGVVVQAAILLPYLKRAGVRLRLKWGIDDRLRRFGNMAVAIIGYVLVLQVGMVITYRIAASATDSGIAVYATSWQLLQLPYGVLGVTILTAIMPRLSRNAAADDTPAVVDDMSLATRLTMIALVPAVAYMTFFGPAIGMAVFNFGNFGEHDASQLGSVLAWGAFTLIPYAMTLVQLRVFYAREDAWTPTLMVVGITAVKVAASYLGPVLFDDPDLVVRWLALANGLGYLVGAIVGHYLLKKRLGGAAMRDVGTTTGYTLVISILVGLVVWGVAEVTHLSRMSTQAGTAGSLAYLVITGVVVLGMIYLLLTAARLPDMVTLSNSVMRLAGRFVPALAPASSPTAVTHDDRPAETTMTLQFPRISADEALPYSGQVEVRRHFDRGSASWRSYSVTSGGAVGETAVIPRVRYPSEEPTVPDRPAERRAGTPPMTPSAPDPIAPRRGPRLVAGAAIAGGRYRLLEQHGAARGMVFWRAKDTVLDREVGLTFVDPDQRDPAYHPDDPESAQTRSQKILMRTRRLGQLRTAGVARILDVVRGASGGIIVTSWVPGAPLSEVARSDPSATGAARAVRTLAAGAEAAHRAGTALSIDHPDRIRISLNGDAVLAFPAVFEGDDRTSDVRGLAAVLYALLLGRWPLDEETGHRVVTSADTDQAPAGLPAPDPDPAHPDQPVEPRAVKPSIGFEISAVAARALAGDRGISSAGTVQHVLDQATVVDLATDLIPRVAGDTPPVSVAPLSRSRRERLLGEGESGRRNGALLVGIGLFVVFLVIAVVIWLTNAFGTSDDVDIDSIVPGESTSQSTTVHKPAPVVAEGVTVFDPLDEADVTAAENAENVLTGAAPPWSTSTYRGTGRFGGLKDGLGLMFTFAPGTTISRVTVQTPTPGMTIELRTAGRATPVLNRTQVVGGGTITAENRTIAVDDGGAKTRYLLLWITELGPTDENGGGYQATIEKVSFTGP